MDIEMTSSGVVTRLPPTSKREILAQLNKALQKNDYGLPDYVYRADLVPLNLSELPAEERHMALAAASCRLEYAEGYPTFEDGSPFWEQMPHEPIRAYEIYLEYLQAPEKSVPVRQLALLASQHKMSLEELKGYFELYYWADRVRAYDLFIVAAHRKQREHRIMTIEGRHFAMADEILQALHPHIMSKLQDADVIEEMPVKEMVDIMEKVVKMQRVSVGLPALGSNTYNNDDAPKNASLEIALKHVAKEAGGEVQQKDTATRANMDNLLQSPEDLMAAQELVIRMSTSFGR